LGFLLGSSTGVVATALAAGATKSPVTPPPAAVADALPLGPEAKIRAALRQRLGDDIFHAWFHTIEVEHFDGRTVTVSLPVKFIRTWVEHYYREDVLACCRAEFPLARRVKIALRQPGSPRLRYV
jgi:chromosomal replication initiator protein